MQRSLLRLARRQSSLWPAGQRAFSQPTGQLTPGELAVADESPFLRFASPVPQPTTYAPLLSSIPDTSVTTLSSGLRVASETTPFAETATVGVWIDAGSRYENAANNGTAHFLEHMAFKGTKSRTTQQLEVEIENMGGHLNAYTSREITCYYAKVLKGDVPKAVEILSDILQNSDLDEQAIERERNVILREMQEVEGVPEEVVFDHLHATAFQHTPLGRTILGPADNIKTLTRGDLADYIATHYTAPRMVVSGAGAIDHSQLVELSEKAFSKLPTTPLTSSDLVKESPTYFTGSDVRIREPDLPLLHWALAFKGASWTDPDAIPLMVIQSIIGAWNKNAGAGGNMSSMMAQRVATNNLAHSYMAFNTNYHDTGLFGVYAVSDPKSQPVDDLAWCIMREMSSLIYNASEEQVVRARNQLKASILFSQDGPGGVAEDIARQLLVYGRRVPKAELFARIDAVDEETVKEVASRFIYDQELAIAAMGDTQTLPDYNWFRRRTYWLRY
ncbi:putative mitochondrial processing peptidase [Coccomyxa subellipsoidea C-169]|uniref:mitochondrial processing peptidase n=1 Tax=Coccomyxa subellipsoidea (strain C-169) TaxID=574566 RepID=I0Z4I1_COCSC|nr:putative mitochondrial processing peptidase [Coccomyxa subellipsoidea C-169]EIE25550.1 putative mitochondrial processing peptidase [Coccomyxa subellipsoidea C-169]|eukprot:XP_005650094.1 putative mitochondrial processing peptidase [Coccomyxa subellipsoidea C-169]